MTFETRFVDLIRIVRRLLIRLTRRPAVGRIDLGDLDRRKPISSNWGLDRGTPVDRVYIERFLADHRDDIRGRVLEVKNNDYTVRFGGDRVSRSDILHDGPGNARATLILDLAATGDAPAELFDCIICTQTLHLIYDMQAAIRSLHKMLKPGGVLLLTVPGICASPRKSMGRYTDYWKFTSRGIERLVNEVFGSGKVETLAYGNVYAATAFLHGLAVEELDPEKLAHADTDYEIVVALRALKSPERS